MLKIKRNQKDSFRFLRASAVKIAFVLFFFASSAVSAQQLTSGADFLKIDSGARSAGMGGAFTGIADDVNALTANPAGLALLTRPEVGYLHMLYLSDIAYNFGGVAFPIQDGENSMGLGAGIINLGTPSFDSTLGVAPAVSAGDNAFLFSYAYRIKNIVSFGATAKYILRGVAGFNASSLGGDFGVLFTPAAKWRIGAGVYNFGQSVQFISEADPLPLTGRLGLAYQLLDIPHHSVMVSVDNAYDLQSSIYSVGAGAEYWYDKTLALRAGYTGDAYQRHWTAGVGVSVSLFEFDYAYAPIGTLGDTHRFSLILRLGNETVAGLQPPAYFTAAPMENGVSLSWKPSPSRDVVGYLLYVKRPGTTAYVKVVKQPLNDTSAKIHSLRSGQDYSFEVSSVSAAGRESSPVEVSARPLAAAAPMAPVLPPAPTGLKALAAGAGLQLVWDKAADMAGYNLYMANDQGQPGKKLSVKLLTENQVTIKKVNPDQVYRFVLTTVNKAGLESLPTAVLSAKLSDFQASAAKNPAPHLTIAAGDASAKLSWDAVNGAAGYQVYSSEDGGATFKQLTKSPIQGLKVTLKPLENGKTYTFAVTSVDASGVESDKAVQSVVPTAGLN